MSTKCKVAACQLTSTNNKEENLASFKKLINKALQTNAKMVFFPEACDFIAQDKNEAKNLSEPLDGHLMREYRNIAKENKIWISIGGFHEKSDETIYNSHVLIDSDGEIRSIYRKIHLFDVTIPEKNVFLRESDLNTGGSQIISPVNTPAGPLALSICYDLRFPEQSVIQTKLGANILTYPSAFTNATGQVHWEVLLRARAIETQCYVIAAAQYGKHNSKRTSFGQSMIIDPWGKILAECPKYTEGTDKDESIAVAEIDLEMLVKIRQEMPVFQHRRNDVYNLNLINKEIYKFNDTDTFKFADKIILGSNVFYRSKYSYAFTNIRCVVPGHVLVATLRQTSRLINLSQEEIADIFQTAIAVQRVMEQEHNCSSSTICVQDGKFAGQTVPHIHIHILPRKLGDFNQNDDVYGHLAKHDKEDNPQPLRDPQEMAKEARRLRKYFA
ncbi:hypothetical protein NQ317_013096 [Molorchus minor]|uniref:Bis(5'-adenosyl)-triphosphatase n=1 Tax=Molorchus minor TaxID=1323400 RepID=A0ABQ9JWZ1_9CUCU|nr:hypothetical protein NQ317_013096 [Molorchus minor]